MAFGGLAMELTEGFFAQHFPGGSLTETGKNYEEPRRQTSDLVRLIQELLPLHFSDNT